VKFQHWLGLAALLTAGLLLWSLREVLIHLFAAVVLAMAICTLVGALRKRWAIQRPLALVVCLLGLVMIVAIAVAVIVPPFFSQFQQLLQQLPAAARELQQIVMGWLSHASSLVYGTGADANGGTRLVPDGLTTIPSSTALASGVSGGIKGLLDLASNLGSGLVQLVFVFAVALMVSIQPQSYRNVAIQLVPSFYRRRAQSILLQCGDALSSWMIGVLISSLCVGLLAGIGLSLLGVKLVMANALLAGLLNIIPNVGPTLSTVFPMAVALLDAPWKAVAVLGLYVVIQNVESYVITPSVMQRQVNLLPGLTLTAQFIFTVLFGPLGLLMALPLAVVMQVLIREIVIHDLLDPWKKRRAAV
jgi:predicted PurR-regulated permease PerM